MAYVNSVHCEVQVTPMSILTAKDMLIYCTIVHMHVSEINSLVIDCLCSHLPHAYLDQHQVTSQF